jgi:hypothetical protein
MMDVSTFPGLHGSRRAALPRSFLVMPGLVPGIHVLAAIKARKAGGAGTSPAMTNVLRNPHFRGFKSLQNLDAPLLCPYTSAVP